MPADRPLRQHVGRIVRAVDPDAPAHIPLHRQPAAAVLVFVGGALGTAARYGLSLALPTTPRHWPWGTFTANLAGAFVLGLLLEALARAGEDRGPRRQLRLLGGTGFCGGFTTYSTFAVEADLLVRDDASGTAVLYLLVTLVAGLGAVVLGVLAASRVRRRDVEDIGDAQ